MLVETCFGSCFVINYSVRLGQVVKWIQLISQRNVDYIGLKNATCRKSARSSFYFERRDHCDQDVVEMWVKLMFWVQLEYSRGC